jgi:hypothetical protein
VIVGRRFPLILLVGLVFVGAAVAFVTLTRPAPTDAPAPDSPPPAAAAPRAAPAPRPAAPAPDEPAHAPREAPRPVPRAAEPESAAPVKGELRIVTDVPAQVFVDRVYLGDAPATASGLAPGSHQLNVTADGFDGYSETIEVPAGSREVRVNFREVRLEASVAVVHKHGIGSCRGRLVATPQGLAYETDNAKDAFRAPLTAVKGFEIDYLKKNLALEVNGKTYNFTDPDGNADPLFVFHRDVEKARQRLLAGDPPASD